LTHGHYRATVLWCQWSVVIAELEKMPEDLKTLIVSSDPHLRKGLKDLLEPKGLDVHTAGDGIEALGCLAQSPFDLI